MLYHRGPPIRLKRLALHLSPNPVAAEDYALPPTGATVAVTGAAGYVGSWIVKLCLQRGHNVRACVRDLEDTRKVGFLKAMPEYGKQLTVYQANMTKEGAYDDIFKGVHTVFHPAEVYMSFSDGRDKNKAKQDFGQKVTLDSLHGNAIQSSQYIVDSINKSNSVKRLVYTSSIAAILPSNPNEYVKNPAIDESREPHVNEVGQSSYGATKRQTEHFFAFAASSSTGRWQAFTGNPGDIIGPILSPHQASETWQGKIARMIQGTPVPQEFNSRPWMIIDVRDVAEAEIRLAESSNIESGSRFLLSSGDKIKPEDIGGRVLELFPDFDPATTCTPPQGKTKLIRNEPYWIRVHLRPDRIQRAIGLHFHSWDETLKDTVDSLIAVGGVKPKTKAIS